MKKLPIVAFGIKDGFGFYDFVPPTTKSQLYSHKNKSQTVPLISVNDLLDYINNRLQMIHDPQTDHQSGQWFELSRLVSSLSEEY